jgi:hypothetical protein
MKYLYIILDAHNNMTVGIACILWDGTSPLLKIENGRVNYTHNVTVLDEHFYIQSNYNHSAGFKRAFFIKEYEKKL